MARPLTACPWPRSGASRRVAPRALPVQAGPADLHSQEERDEKAAGPAVLVGQTRRRSGPPASGGVLRTAVLRPVTRVPTGTWLPHRSVGGRESLARYHLVHRRRRLRLLRIARSRHHAIHAGGQHPRRPIPSVAAQHAPSRIPGGLGMARNTVRRSARRCGLPILSNIYLDRLDSYVENVLIPEYTRGTGRAPNPDYQEVEKQLMRARRRGDRPAVRALRKQ